MVVHLELDALAARLVRDSIALGLDPLAQDHGLGMLGLFLAFAGATQPVASSGGDRGFRERSEPRSPESTFARRHANDAQLRSRIRRRDPGVPF